MESQGIRGTTLTMAGSNNENEVGMGPAAAKGRVLRAKRTAMTDIGNKANILQNAKNQIVKKEAIRPARGLSKQKATTSLAQLVPQVVPTTRVTRKSAELKKNDEDEVPMDLDVSKAMEDIEMAELAAPAVQAYSAKYLENVDDIDKDDVENPQLVVEYVNEIYGYLRQLEVEQAVEEDYLNKSKMKTSVTPKNRAVLIDWLVQVNSQFKLLQETLYLTVAVVDRYLQHSAGKVEKKNLQLVGVASMLVAAKYEEMYAPEIGDFVYITDNAYTEKQIRKMEIEVLTVLAYDLGRPLPLHFLRRNSKAGGVDALTHTLAKYAMELSLVEYEMAHVKPSILAAAALAISLKVLDQSGDDKSIVEMWTPTLVHYTSYTFDMISDTVQQLAEVLWSTSVAPKTAKLMAVKTKYKDNKLGKISMSAQLTGIELEKLKIGNFQ
jgi:cyclin B